MASAVHQQMRLLRKCPFTGRYGIRGNKTLHVHVTYTPERRIRTYVRAYLRVPPYANVSKIRVSQCASVFERNKGRTYRKVNKAESAFFRVSQRASDYENSKCRAGIKERIYGNWRELVLKPENALLKIADGEQWWSSFFI